MTRMSEGGTGAGYGGARVAKHLESSQKLPNVGGLNCLKTCRERAGHLSIVAQRLAVT
jgi:hypothetical protein